VTPVVRSIVFCDVDETLIGCKSLFDFQHYYLTEKCGDPGARRAERTRRDFLARAASGMPREHANREYYRVWEGERAAEVEQAAERWWGVRSKQPGFLIAATLAELTEHRAAGAAIVLVSGSFPAVLRPVAEHVGATRILCTVPQISAGRFTGRVDGAPMIGEAKREAVREVLRSHPSADSARCFAYGDHVSDLPMLSEVGHPVVVGAAPDVLRGVPHARVLPAW
jgi:HAD superfamily hydrolase (TIGR01490 family)